MLGRPVLMGLVLCLLPVLAWAQTVDDKPPKTVWDADLDGTAIHRMSELQCPNASAQFRRTTLTMYNPAGLDVSCNYRAPGGDDITIYLTLNDGMTLAKALGGAKQALVDREPTAKLRDGTMPRPGGLDWASAGYQEKDGAVYSDIYYALLPGWLYEIRVSYAPADAAMVEAALDDLSATVSRTAGRHLAACAAAAAPFPGQALSLDSTTQMALTLTALAEPLDGTELSGEGALWCAQHALGFGGRPFVYWRNLAPEAKGVVDRITPISGEDRIVVLADPAGTAVARDKAGSKPGAVFDLLIDNKDTATLIGLYDGRPPLDQIVKQLQAGAPLAQMHKADKKMTIFTK